MTPTFVLWSVGALLSLSALAIAEGRARLASSIIYRACCAVSSVLFLAAATHIGSPPVESVLPMGIPWLGAHFRLDPLAAFFLAVVNLGGAIASLYAVGYGRHEAEPARVLPFFPAFLAGMNLVLVAADAFTFLLAWEFMSLSLWVLAVSHHRNPA